AAAVAAVAGLAAGHGRPCPARRRRGAGGTRGVRGAAGLVGPPPAGFCHVLVRRRAGRRSAPHRGSPPPPPRLTPEVPMLREHRSSLGRLVGCTRRRSCTDHGPHLRSSNTLVSTRPGRDRLVQLFVEVDRPQDTRLGLTRLASAGGNRRGG